MLKQLRYVALACCVLAVVAVIIIAGRLKSASDFANLPVAHVILPRPVVRWQQGVQALDFSPDNTMLAASDCQLNLQILQAGNLQPVQSIPVEQHVDAETLKWTTDGKQLFEGGGLGNGISGVCQWDIASQVTTPIVGQKIGIEHVQRSFFEPTYVESPSQTVIAGGIDDSTLKIFNLTTRKAYSPTLPRAYKSSRVDVQVFAFHDPKSTAAQPLPTADPILSMAFSPDSSTLAVVYVQYIGAYPFSQAILCLYNAQNGALVRSWPLQQDSVSQGLFGEVTLEFLQDGSELAIEDDHRITLWNVATGTAARTMSLNNGIDTSRKCLAYVPNQPLLVSMPGGNDVNIWNTATGEMVQTFHGKDNHTAIAVSNDGHYLAIGGENSHSDGIIDLWDISKVR